MKALKWLGSSKKDLLEFPKEVIQEMGYALKEEMEVIKQRLKLLKTPD